MLKHTHVQPAPQVLHVAESYAGGVSAAILDYVESSTHVEHHLLYAERADAPISARALKGYKSVTAMTVGHVRRMLQIKRLASSGRFDFVHAHSSFAGAYVRLALRSSKTPIVYTPHCYAFERRDLRPFARRTFEALEGLLATNTTTFAACSPREAELSLWRGTKASVTVVPNVAPKLPTARAEAERAAERFHVVGAGRASRQKDPSFFFECVDRARAAGHDVLATWIGGDDSLRQQGSQHGVEVTGWLPREEAVRKLLQADLYLHSAAWEGFPVAVLEAINAGVPTVVRSIPAFEGVSIPKILDAEEFAGFLAAHGDESGLAQIRAAGSDAVQPFNAETQRAALQAVYSRSNTSDK